MSSLTYTFIFQVTLLHVFTRYYTYLNCIIDRVITSILVPGNGFNWVYDLQVLDWLDGSA